MKKHYLLAFLASFLFIFTKAQFPNCNAQFSFTISGNTVAVVPANAQTDSISEHFWNFGDGYTSNTTFTTHTYNQCGTYVITHTVTGFDSSSNPCGDSSLMVINISCGNPCNIQASFSAQLDSINPTFVNFFNNSSFDPNTPIVFDWDFGDGSVSTTTDLAGFSHIYANPGIYNVCVVAYNSNANCADTFCLNVVAQDNPPACDIVANFIYDTTSASNFIFTDQSTSSSSGIVSYLWNFGDGSSSTLQNPVHQFTAPGVYTVCLTVTNAGNTGAPPCSQSICYAITVFGTPTPCNDPIGFGWQQDPSLNGNVTFVNTSAQGDTTAWITWTFGDSTGGQYGLQVTHTFANSGSYWVCMSQSLPNGCTRDTCYLVSVTVNNTNPCNLVATFDALPAPNTNSTFVFSNTTMNSDPNSLISWSFGDGTSATGNNISHSYNQPGNYLVCMHIAVSNTCFADTCIYVTVNNSTPCNLYAGFTVAATPSAANAYLFTASNNYPSAQTNWYFSDSSFATGQIVQHIFPGPGNYQVCLNVSLAGCTADTCLTITVVDSVVNIPQPSNVLITYPNPATNQLNFVVNSGQNQPLVATIYNMQNVMIAQYTLTVVSGNQAVSLPIGTLPPGMYVLKLNYGGQVNATLFQKL